MRQLLVVVSVVFGLLSAGIGRAEDRAANIRPLPEKPTTVFVVITPPAHGQKFCSIVPLERTISKGVNHVTIINLSPEPVEVKVSSQIAKTDGSSLVRELRRDDYIAFELKPLGTGKYSYSLNGPDKGCLWLHPDYGGSLPNPKIVIP